MPNTCAISYHESGDLLDLRITGRGTMNPCPGLRRFIEQELKRGVRRLSVDLHECTYMDSTFVGTLLALLHKIDAERGTFELVAPSDECRRVLRQMGLEEVIPIVTPESREANQWTPLPQEKFDRTGFDLNVLQAHRELASLPGAVGEQFRGLIPELEAEVAARR